MRRSSTAAQRITAAYRTSRLRGVTTHDRSHPPQLRGAFNASSRASTAALAAAACARTSTLAWRATVDALVGTSLTYASATRIAARRSRAAYTSGQLVAASAGGAAGGAAVRVAFHSKAAVVSAGVMRVRGAAADTIYRLGVERDE